MSDTNTAAATRPIPNLNYASCYPWTDAERSVPLSDFGNVMQLLRFHGVARVDFLVPHGAIHALSRSRQCIYQHCAIRGLWGKQCPTYLEDISDVLRSALVHPADAMSVSFTIPHDSENGQVEVRSILADGTRVESVMNVM